MNYEEEERLYKKAKKRVAKKKGFYRHLQVYVLINLFVFLTNFFTGGHLFETAPMSLAWGVGLALHYFNVFGMPGGKMTEEWEEKELEAEMNKLRRKETLRNDKKHVTEHRDKLDLDERLDLREAPKMKDYGDEDFV